MNTIGSTDIFTQAGAARLQGAKSAPSNKEPVDTRIRTLQNEKTAREQDISRNMKDLEQMRTQLFSGIQTRDKQKTIWKSCGIISLATGMMASSLGGGIPALVMMGLSAVSAIAGGIAYLKERNLNSNLTTLTAGMTYKSGSNSANQMENTMLEFELESAKKEKTEITKHEINKMAEGLKEDKPSTGKKRGIIEDLGSLIKINGITLKKRKD